MDEIDIRLDKLEIRIERIEYLLAARKWEMDALVDLLTDADVGDGSAEEDAPLQN